MKNLTKLIVSMLLLFIFTKAFSQSDVAGVVVGHVGVAGYYCGWDAATPIPFNLQHLANQNMNFRTNFALAPAGAGNRMIIRNDFTTPTGFPINFFTGGTQRITIAATPGGQVASDLKSF